MVWAAMTFVTKIKNSNGCLRSLHLGGESPHLFPARCHHRLVVSGTIRSCQKAALRYNRLLLLQLTNLSSYSGPITPAKSAVIAALNSAPSPAESKESKIDFSGSAGAGAGSGSGSGLSVKQSLDLKARESLKRKAEEMLAGAEKDILSLDTSELVVKVLLI